MLAHLRTEAYPVYREHVYPPPDEAVARAPLSYERNIARIDAAKRAPMNATRLTGIRGCPLAPE